MGKFFEELAKKLAEKWVSLLLLPGILFAAAAWLGTRLGHRHAWDRSLLNRAVSDTAAAVGRQSAGTQVLLLAGALLVSTGIGLAVQAMAGPTRLLWLGQWPRPPAWPGARLVRNRRDRWLALVERRQELENAAPAESRTPAQQYEVDLAAARVNRLAMAMPGRPTWMGDRIHAVEQIARDRYGLDLAFAWPRLWLVLPENTRADITAAHAGFAAAVATGTWAWPYLILGAVWWPAALAGIGIGLTGWTRARAAIADVGTMSEAALDVHGRALAVALGVGAPNAVGPLTPVEGEALTGLLRKGR
ncbi:hypothetical protein ACFWBN_22080 [Streptomyces sp. NPDC059989]|uniref:hypothetical protein n=1 Tax=Streptomyces sp. NPDC059989 TaxID=3347026 RepID=UPI00367AA5BF